MTDDGLMIKSTSLKDVGTYECMVKKENIELKSRPAKIILEPDVSGCKYIFYCKGSFAVTCQSTLYSTQ